MKTILVVDDVAANLTLMRGILRTKFELCLAKSTDLAFAVLERTHVDMILLDIAMPGMNGFEFLSIIRKNPVLKTIPVILITGSTAVEYANEAQKADIAAFIQKPIEAAFLISKIDEVLSEKS
jgi:CheY-like chemotaxis protein